MNQVAFLASDRMVPAHFGAISSRFALPQPDVFLRRASPNEQDRLAASAVAHVVDFDGKRLNSIAAIFQSAGIETRSYPDLRTFSGADLPDRPGCVLVHAEPSQLDGREGRLQSVGTHLPVIMTSELPDVRTVVLAMKLGAIDFLEQPFLAEEVIRTVEFAIGLDRERRQADAQKKEVCRRFETLSNRERQVLALVTEGMLNKQVAYELGISEITVKAHRGCVMRKMGARTFAALVRMADLVAVRPCSQQPDPCAL